MRQKYQYDLENEVIFQGAAETYSVKTDQATLDALESGDMQPRKAIAALLVDVSGSYGEFIRNIKTDLEAA